MRRAVVVCFGLAGMLLSGFLTTACSTNRDEGGDAAAKVKSIAQLPKPVRDTLRLFAPAKAKPGGMEREEEHGLVTWSSEYETNAGDIEITALSDGTLVSIEQESKPAALPREVASAGGKALGGKPKEADHVRLAAYELEDHVQKGTVRERFVDPFGRVLLERLVVESPETTPEAISDLPAPVRATLDHETGGAEPTSLRVEEEWGQTVHAASWHAGDGRREVKILEDGRVLYLELPTGPVPARVAALITEGAGQAEAGAEANEQQAEKPTAESASEGEEKLAEAGGSEKAEGHDRRATSSVGVERVLLDAWEVHGERDGRNAEVLILETGKILNGTDSSSTGDKG